MTARRLVIAGTGSGVGKTTAAIGLMAAYRARGLAVKGFKCGPDYIDPTYHAAVTGRISRNLDSWMCGEDAVRDIFAQGCRDADLAIVEGVMGMFDGKDPSSNAGSTAEIAALTDAPVLLVVDCGGMARSAAAIVRGFQTFSSEARLCGVIANRVGSGGHYALIKQAVEQSCGVPVFGYLERDERLEMPERHLGLVPSIERGELQPFFDRLAETVERCIDLDALFAALPNRPYEAPGKLFAGLEASSAGARDVRIAVAKDEAFHFYYAENLELLEREGAEIVYFSPLRGETVPNHAHGLYLGGGFPEMHAQALSRQTAVSASVREAVERGMPTLAECGGYMYLAEAIETADGARYPMVGLIPGTVKMQSRLAALGYRNVAGMPGNFLVGPDDRARGHEFHYSAITYRQTPQPAYYLEGSRGSREDGYVHGRLAAGYTHLHFASDPGLARRWAAHCRQYRDSLR